MVVATPDFSAPQHGHEGGYGPRPLPLFLAMLRSETAASPERQAAAMTGLAAYQAASRPPRPEPAPVAFAAGRATLRDYGGDGSPVVFVPSLINPPLILDLAAENSLLRWLSGQGLHPYLLDWGEPSPDERDLDVTGHVEQLLLPLLAQLDRPPLLVGYCLGGTMALAAASIAPVAGVATIAAPWRFAGYGDALGDMRRLWDSAEPLCGQMGLVPMEVLQSGFWQLDPGRTVAKYEAFAAMEPDSDAARAFIALEDWANAGAPLTYAAGRQLFDDFLTADLPGTGGWTVAGMATGPDALRCPAIEFVSLTDRIVPAATAAGLTERRDTGAGHVGMVVGSRGRSQLWEPLRDWLLKHRGDRVAAT